MSPSCPVPAHEMANPETFQHVVCPVSGSSAGGTERPPRDPPARRLRQPWRCLPSPRCRPHLPPSRTAPVSPVARPLELLGKRRLALVEVRGSSLRLLREFLGQALRLCAGG